jgi:hypothetical protein
VNISVGQRSRALHLPSAPRCTHLTLARCPRQGSEPTSDIPKYSIPGTKLHQVSRKPLLFVDIDGVLSLWGFDMDGWPSDGAWHQVDGVSHFLSARAARHLQALCARFDPVWCSGWEEKADEHLPLALGVPSGRPHLTFDGRTRNQTSTRGHWKLAAIERHAGERPAAWIDDAHDDACRAWAAARQGRTLLVTTDAGVGLTATDADTLEAWGRAASAPAAS